jgi:hypothetical protein
MLRIVRSVDAGNNAGREWPNRFRQLAELRQLVDEELTRDAVLYLAEVPSLMYSGLIPDDVRNQRR